MHVLFAEGLHDEPWLEAHTIGWRDLRDRVASYPPERVAAITGIPAETIVALARRYGTTKPALLKFADGVQRHGNGGQTVRAMCCLPAVVGQVGVRGGGLSYSTSDYVRWDAEALGHASECPPTPRMVNMNRMGAALTGEAERSADQVALRLLRQSGRLDAERRADCRRDDSATTSSPSSTTSL